MTAVKIMKPLLLTAVLIAVSGCLKSNTDYSSPDLPEKFPIVKIGDSLETVYSTLGPPLEVEINPDRWSKASKQDAFDIVSIQAVQKLLSDTNKEAYLIYSRPQKGDSYLLYWITVAGGKVTAKQGPNPMD